MVNEDTINLLKECNVGAKMGIKSICRYLNEYDSAMESIKGLCYGLVELEENFSKDLRSFL